MAEGHKQNQNKKLEDSENGKEGVPKDISVQSANKDFKDDHHPLSRSATDPSPSSSPNLCLKGSGLRFPQDSADDHSRSSNGEPSPLNLSASGEGKVQAQQQVTPEERSYLERPSFKVEGVLSRHLNLEESVVVSEDPNLINSGEPVIPPSPSLGEHKNSEFFDCAEEPLSTFPENQPQLEVASNALENGPQLNSHNLPIEILSSELLEESKGNSQEREVGNILDASDIINLEGTNTTSGCPNPISNSVSNLDSPLNLESSSSGHLEKPSSDEVVKSEETPQPDSVLQGGPVPDCKEVCETQEVSVSKSESLGSEAGVGVEDKGGYLEFVFEEAKKPSKPPPRLLGKRNQSNSKKRSKNRSKQTKESLTVKSHNLHSHTQNLSKDSEIPLWKEGGETLSSDLENTTTTGEKLLLDTVQSLPALNGTSENPPIDSIENIRHTEVESIEETEQIISKFNQVSKDLNTNTGSKKIADEKLFESTSQKPPVCNGTSENVIESEKNSSSDLKPLESPQQNLSCNETNVNLDSHIENLANTEGKLLSDTLPSLPPCNETSKNLSSDLGTKITTEEKPLEIIVQNIFESSVPRFEAKPSDSKLPSELADSGTENLSLVEEDTSHKEEKHQISNPGPDQKRSQELLGSKSTAAEVSENKALANPAAINTPHTSTEDFQLGGPTFNPPLPEVVPEITGNPGNEPQSIISISCYGNEEFEILGNEASKLVEELTETEGSSVPKTPIMEEQSPSDNCSNLPTCRDSRRETPNKNERSSIQASIFESNSKKDTLFLQVGDSEAGPDIATGLTSSDLKCASQFFREAAELESQIRRNIASSIGSLNDYGSESERANFIPENEDYNSNRKGPQAPSPPHEERSAPEGTSSPDPRSLEDTEVRNRRHRSPVGSSNHEVNDLLKKQALEFEEKLLRQGIVAAEKEKELHELLKGEQKQMQKVTAANDALLKLVEQYKGMLAALVSEKEKASSDQEEKLKTVQEEKQQAIEDLSNVEAAFSDVHRKYERTKQIVDSLKRNEETLRSAVTDYEQKLLKQERKFAELQKLAEEKVKLANDELDGLRRSNDQEMTRMGALLKKAEMKIISLQEALERKSRENQELTQLCDDLISKVGS